VPTPSPSRKDRRGVKRRRLRASELPSLLGTVLYVPHAHGEDAGAYFSALTAREYAERVDDPRRGIRGRSLAPRGAAGKRAALRAAERVEVLCRCERRLVWTTRGLVENGYQPRCNPTCEARRRKADQ
jgi:hypothetical protein